jgi:hypothetical protein
MMVARKRKTDESFKAYRETLAMKEQSKIEAQAIVDAASVIVPVNCPSCEHRKDLVDRIAQLLEAKLKRIEDRMKTIKAGSEPPYDNLLQRDRNTVHIVMIEDLGQELELYTKAALKRAYQDMNEI